MFVLNLLSPRLTHLWAKNKTYFGSRIYAFYTSLARKMPFRWAKWWMDPKDATGLYEFSTKQQVAFFNKVSPTAETFNALSSKAVIMLIKQLPREQLFELLPKVRFSGDVLTYLRTASRYDILEEYIRHGALCMAALNDFIESVTKQYSKAKIHFLEKYAIRYGLTSAEMDKLQHCCTTVDIKILQRANLCHEQCRKVHCFCGLVNEQEEKRWAEFCTNTELEPEAQAEMNLKQYKIFAGLGKHLAHDAVMALLKKPNEEYWQQIFANEPPIVFNTLEIAYVILDNPKLQKMFHSSAAGSSES